MFLSEIIRNFDSQLSQEQTWAICDVTSKYLSSKRRENTLTRRRVRFEIEAETIQLTEDGGVVIMMKEERRQQQNEAEIILSLGQLLCKCLDGGLDSMTVINNNNLEPDLIQLISKMFGKSDEDEGYEEDLDERIATRDANYISRRFRNFDEICRFCDERLRRRKITSHSEHYRNVVKALYGEAIELKSFLDHVSSSLCLASENSEHRSLEPNIANTAQECVYEWARLWLQVMHELRRGVHLRKVVKTKISPEEYELSPYEMALGTAASKKVVPKPDTKSGLPENASEIILDFILSRPTEKKKKTLLPYIEEVDQEGNDLEVSNFLDDGKDGFEDRRKSLKVESPLWSKINNWDASLESLLSDDTQLEPRGGVRFQDDCKLVSVFSDEETPSRRNSVDLGLAKVKRKENQRRRSADLSLEYAAESANVHESFENLDTLDGTLDKSKKRLAVSALCLTEVSLEEDPRAVGTSLFEISKTRQAITFAEIDSLSKTNAKDRSVKNGKICFQCRKASFSLFNKAHICDICCKKFCHKCIIVNMEIPSHLIDTKTCKEEYSLAHTKGLSKSLGNLSMGIESDTITPFPCKRQTMLRISNKQTFGGKTSTVCVDCKTFMDSIITETKNMRWHVGMAMDI